MDDQFYAIVKLISGEEIFAIVSPTLENNIEYLIVSDPIKATKFTDKEGTSGYKLEPWLKMTSETIFILEKTKILIVTESFDDEMIQLYKKYLRTTNAGLTGTYTLNKSEGYINNVKEARTLLEKIYKSR